MVSTLSTSHGSCWHYSKILNKQTLFGQFCTTKIASLFSHQQYANKCLVFSRPFICKKKRCEIDVLCTPLKGALRDILNPFCWTSESNQDYQQNILFPSSLQLSYLRFYLCQLVSGSRFQPMDVAVCRLSLQVPMLDKAT